MARASAAVSRCTAGLRVSGAGVGRGIFGGVGIGPAGDSDVVMLTPPKGPVDVLFAQVTAPAPEAGGSDQIKIKVA
jgi:hypothetical protein